MTGTGDAGSCRDGARHKGLRTGDLILADLVLTGPFGGERPAPDVTDTSSAAAAPLSHARWLTDPGR